MTSIFDFSEYKNDLRTLNTKYAKELSTLLEKYSNTYKDTMLAVLDHPDFKDFFLRRHLIYVNEELKLVNDSYTDLELASACCLNVLGTSIRDFLGYTPLCLVECDSKLEDKIINDLSQELNGLKNIKRKLCHSLNMLDTDDECNCDVYLIEIKETTATFVIEDSSYTDYGLSLHAEQVLELATGNAPDAESRYKLTYDFSRVVSAVEDFVYKNQDEILKESTE